jgi:hypothetical protein
MMHAFAAEVRPGGISEENRHAPMDSEGSATGELVLSDSGKTLSSTDTRNNPCDVEIGGMSYVTAQKTFGNSGIPGQDEAPASFVDPDRAARLIARTRRRRTAQ